MRDEGTAEAAVDVRCLGVIDSFGDRSSNCSHSTHSSLVSSRRKKITELPIYPRTDIGYDFDREKLWRNFCICTSCFSLHSNGFVDAKSTFKPHKLIVRLQRSLRTARFV